MRVDAGRMNLTDRDFVRIDGIPLFKLLLREGVPTVQFHDGDRLRAQCRGDVYVEMPLAEFISRLGELLDKGAINP